MSYGLKVLNESGLVQFSTETSTKPLYSKIVSGTISINARADLSSETFTTIAAGTAIGNIISGLSQSDLILAYRPTSNSTLYARVLSSMGSYRIYNISFSAVDVQYCIFVKSNEYTAPNSGYGLNVFDTDGSTLKYSSEYAPASVETVLTVDLSNFASSTSYTYDSSTGLGRPWALATSGQGVTYSNGYNFEADQSGSGIGEWYVNGIEWTNTQIRSTAVEFINNNITQSSFFDKVGATYDEAKLVVLRGYDYT